jgi:hypothetical protein
MDNFIPRVWNCQHATKCFYNKILKKPRKLDYKIFLNNYMKNHYQKKKYEKKNFWELQKAFSWQYLFQHTIINLYTIGYVVKNDLFWLYLISFYGEFLCLKRCHSFFYETELFLLKWRHCLKCSLQKFLFNIYSKHYLSHEDAVLWRYLLPMPSECLRTLFSNFKLTTYFHF